MLFSDLLSVGSRNEPDTFGVLADLLLSAAQVRLKLKCGTLMMVSSDSRQAEAVEGDLTWRGETAGVNGLATSKDRGDSALI